MKLIGIVTCANATQNMGCSSVACFREFNSRSGVFEKYGKGTQLIGLISCAGCPTVLAPEKLLNRIKMLVSSGVDSIHLSSCMKLLCPFCAQYLRIIGEAYPHIELVCGTHDGSEDEVNKFLTGAKIMLTQDIYNMADFLSDYELAACPVNKV